MMLHLALAAMPGNWTLFLAGDIMLNGVSPKTNPFAAIAPLARTCDLAIANLEIPLTRASTRTPHKSAADLRRRAQFILKADPAHVRWLVETGLDGLSLANNHAMDYGVAGLNEMRSLLSRHRLAHAGAGKNLAEAIAPALVPLQQRHTVSLISYLSFMSDGGNDACTPATPRRAGIAALKLQGTVEPEDRLRLRREVELARRRAGFVVVALHWGLEKQTVPTGYQVALGRAWIDAGADVVVGHHPHVLQGAELYRGKPIFYSLGNFMSPRPSNTGLIKARFKGETLGGVSFLPCRIAGGRITPHKGQAAVAELRRFRTLGEALRKRFPHPESLPLAVALEPPPITTPRKPTAPKSRPARR